MELRTAVALAALTWAAAAGAQEPEQPAQQGGVHRIDAMPVKADAAAAQGELPRAPGEGESAVAGMASMGGGARQSGREASEDLPPPRLATVCSEGLVPQLHDGQPIIDASGKPMCRARRQFIKGELTNLGAAKLLVKDSRFGLRFGYARLDQSSYLSINPELDLRFGDFAIGLGVPLNVRAYANGFTDGGGVHLRPHDYDTASDYARILRFLTYGNKEDNIYLNVSQLFAASIGHGAIVRRYSGNIDQNVTRVGAQLDAYGRFGGFEAFVGDVVHPDHFVSGLIFLKPLGWVSGPLLDTLGQTSVGVTAAADLRAPFRLNRIPGNYPDVGDDGEPTVGVDRKAIIVGLDVETKIVKTEGADLKPFVDYSRMADIQDEQGKTITGGGGWTLGFLGRFNTGDVKVHAFRAVAEGRYFDGNYLPGYFDTFYEVQKYQFVTGKASPDYNPKLFTILTRNPAQKRAGFYAELAYQYNGGLALIAAYEDSYQVSGPDTVCDPAQSAAACNAPDRGSRNLTLHMEYPVFSWVQFFASYYHRSFGGAPVDFNKPLGDNTLIYSAIRIHILPILFLNARVYRSWQADPVLGQERNVWGGDADLELGYEFNRKN